MNRSWADRAIIMMWYFAFCCLSNLILSGVVIIAVNADGPTLSSRSQHSVAKKHRKLLPPNLAPVTWPLSPDIAEELRVYKLDLYQQFRKIHPKPIKNGSGVRVDLGPTGSILSVKVGTTGNEAEDRRLLEDVRKLKYKPLPKGVTPSFAWVMFSESQIDTVSHPIKLLKKSNESGLLKSDKQELQETGGEKTK